MTELRQKLRPLVLWAGALGAVGLALTLVGILLDPLHALYSYLTAYLFWLGLALGLLAWLMALHASKARWSVVFRRPLEVGASALLPLGALFAPIALGVRQLYEWTTPSPAAAASGDESLGFRHAYLTAPSFIARAALYLVLWAVAAELLLRWSSRQDEERSPALTQRQRTFSGGFLPLLGLTGTWASFDWVMSLTPRWHSSTFGFYFLSGAAVGSMAVLILVTWAADGAGLFPERLRVAHYHNQGKLLFAFVCFWAYIAFTQYLLIWIANLPQEIPWMILRTTGGWAWVGLLLMLGHFVLPFVVLLPRTIKTRPLGLSVMAVWILLVHYADSYWLVMPRLYPEGPAPRWTDLTALCGIGGACVSFAAYRLGGRAATPMGDPYLSESLRYERS
ncbi:MAG: hypothetical protein ACYCWW_05100 [Deltaproteobacteria bacterium]